MRAILPCLTAAFLAACGASVTNPAGSADAGASPDVLSAPDVPAAPDVSSNNDVPSNNDVRSNDDVPTVPRDAPTITDVPPEPARCALAGPWTGWWSWTEGSQPVMRSRISMVFGERGVSGRSMIPSGSIDMGSLGADREVRFWVRSNPEDVGFAFTGALSEDCSYITGRYATHSYGGSFELVRQVCPPPTRALALGATVEDNLTNAPIANIADCGRGDPVQHHVYSLTVPRAGTVALALDALDASGRNLGVSLRADCDAPETECPGPGTTLRRAVPAGTYRVVVSTTINRWIPYRLRATLEE